MAAHFFLDIPKMK